MPSPWLCLPFLTCAAHSPPFTLVIPTIVTITVPLSGGIHISLFCLLFLGEILCHCCPCPCFDRAKCELALATSLTRIGMITHPLWFPATPQRVHNDKNPSNPISACIAEPPHTLYLSSHSSSLYSFLSFFPLSALGSLPPPHAL